MVNKKKSKMGKVLKNFQKMERHPWPKEKRKEKKKVRTPFQVETNIKSENKNKKEFGGIYLNSLLDLKFISIIQPFGLC